MSSPLSPIYVFTSIELVWVFASPLVVLWDVAYVLLRPLSMPGGTIHYPIWVPYELYGRVDHLYGVPALERSDGLVTAYAIINFLESASYIWCAWKIFCESKASPEGVWYIEGRVGNRVMLALFSTSLTVCTKTILYGKALYHQTRSREIRANQLQLLTRYFRTSQMLVTTAGQQ